MGQGVGDSTLPQTLLQSGRACRRSGTHQALLMRQQMTEGSLGRPCSRLCSQMGGRMAMLVLLDN